MRALLTSPILLRLVLCVVSAIAAAWMEGAGFRPVSILGAFAVLCVGVAAASKAFAGRETGGPRLKARGAASR